MLLQKEFLPPTQKLINDCLHGINERLGNVERSNTLSVSTFLDPRFKNLAFSNLSSADNARKNVQEALGEKLSAQLLKFNIAKTDDDDKDDEFSIWGSFDQSVAVARPRGTVTSRAIIEIQRYIEEDLVPRNSDPLKWWREHTFHFPNLSVVTQKKIVCSSFKSWRPSSQ
jgi:hypothetical protein